MLWKILVFTFVQSTAGIITIHRSATARRSCEDENLNDISPNQLYCEGHLMDPSSHQNEKFSELNIIASNDSIFSKAIIFSLASASLVGLSGIFPLVMFHKTNIAQLKDSKTLNRLLSFAVGGLLGDVFLHLLPESWNASVANDGHFHSNPIRNGSWVLIGLTSFWILEKLFPDESSETKEQEGSEPIFDREVKYQNCNGNNNVENWTPEDDCLCSHKDQKNGSAFVEKSNHFLDKSSAKTNVRMSGYLNLMANFVDNFTHGLAIGGSYLVSQWVGIVTTLAILLHEIPHEIGDFAILLRAGFDRWKAAKYQLLTATGGLLGALFAHFVGGNATDGRVAWILPFTSGGFIYIALCTVVPDLLNETSPKESIIQILLMISGIGVMGLVGLIE